MGKEMEGQKDCARQMKILEDEIEKLENNIERLENKIEELEEGLEDKADIDKITNALRVYANPQNWKGNNENVFDAGLENGCSNNYGYWLAERTLQDEGLN